MEKLMTVKDLSEWLQVSPRTVYDWVHVGFIPHYKLSKGVRFKPSEVESWLKKRHRKGRTTYKLDIPFQS
jgi:excisionase family DNA binding protein